VLAYRFATQLWIAASTLPGEEELVLDAFATLLASRPALKLMIAPRHADRFDSVEEIIRRRGFTYARRSRLSGNSSAPVLLLDTIGELAAVFEFATVVFMGGSLVARGGHNVLEPARFEKPIVFGPHMENFRDMASLFLNGKAAIQVQNASELPHAIENICRTLSLQSSVRTQTIVEQNTGATNRVLRFLSRQRRAGEQRIPFRFRPARSQYRRSSLDGRLDHP
jgi:3-deoxy-D-manno-octulosonic-acid transferase